MTIRDQSDIVLVVDDSPNTVRLLTDVLEAENKTVTIALDGATALRIAARVRPDVVLMDAVMPEMDGFECCRRLKEMSGFDNVPIIFMTGLGEPGDSVRGFGVGGADYVTKPIDIDAMLARIDVHLSNARKIQSARMALDATEQVLLATTEHGDVAWFTPRAYRLLQQHFDDGAGHLALQKDVRDWVRKVGTAGSQSDGRTLFSSPTLNLHIDFVRRTERGELLFRLSDVSRAPHKLGSRYNLSPREAEVLSWLAKGKSNRDIADILELSPRTVDKHLQSIFAKLNVENRTAAAATLLGLLA